MVGGLLAATEEAPGEVVERPRQTQALSRHGIARRHAGGQRRPVWSGGAHKLVPEGVAGTVAFAGDVASVLFQLVGGLRSGMGYLGAANLDELLHQARFVRVSDAGVRESHVHDLTTVEAATNYCGRS